MARGGVLGKSCERGEQSCEGLGLGGVRASGDGILQAYKFVAILHESLKFDSYGSGSTVTQQHSLVSVYIRLCTS